MYRLNLASRRSLGTRAPGGGGAEWTPEQLSAQLWLRADLGITVDGSNLVSAWANQGSAGSALDWSQGTASKRPPYVASSANFSGQATVAPDGVNRKLVTASTTALDAGDTDDISIVCVHRFDAAATGKQHIFSATSWSTSGIYYEHRIGAGGTFGVSDGTGTTYGLNASTAGGHAHVHRVSFTGNAGPTADDYAEFHDGVAGASDSTVNSGDLSTGGSTYEMFEFGTSFDMNGELAELIVRVGSVFTADELADLTDYINSRYGLSLGTV